MSARKALAYVGLTPSENSSGEKISRSSIEN
nr:transposase [Bacillus toyonensis]